MCMDADISIDSYPSTDFGVLQWQGGPESAPMPCLRILRSSDNNWLSLSLLNWPAAAVETQERHDTALGVGMSLTANIKLRKVSYLQLLLGEFQDKAESLQRL